MNEADCFQIEVAKGARHLGLEAGQPFPEASETQAFSIGYEGVIQGAFGDSYSLEILPVKWGASWSAIIMESTSNLASSWFLQFMYRYLNWPVMKEKTNRL